MVLTETQQKVLDSINTIMVNTSLDNSFYQDVILRLDSLGYTVKTTDDWVLSFTMQTVEAKVKRECNIIIIPDGLLKSMVDMVCGEFLYYLQQTGKLGDSFNVDAAAKAIKMGDVSVELSGGSTMSLDYFIRYLREKGGDYSCYRRLTW